MTSITQDEIDAVHDRLRPATHGDALAIEKQLARIEALLLDGRVAELEAALTTIRDMLPVEQDEYSRRVFAIAANVLEP